MLFKQTRKEDIFAVGKVWVVRKNTEMLTVGNKTEKHFNIQPVAKQNLHFCIHCMLKYK